MAILHPRDVAPQQTSSFLDIALRKALIFAKLTKPFTNNHVISISSSKYKFIKSSKLLRLAPDALLDPCSPIADGVGNDSYGAYSYAFNQAPLVDRKWLGADA